VNCRQSPLHLAVKDNYVGPILAMIEHMNNLSKIEKKNDSGPSLLMPDFNLKNSDGDTPLSLALDKGYIIFYYIFMRNVCFCFNFYFLSGYLSLVDPLIKGGGDVNIRNGRGFTLLHQAIMKEDSKTAIFLLDNGADMNALYF